ncbi:MAG: hypothetical protein KatS3mg111_0383 [Pirellulaceae bacterium]|nr:MAG: hypothetical protein KatS3mg111_0383 [Pirellulaceae bacterium]
MTEKPRNGNPRILPRDSVLPPMNPEPPEPMDSGRATRNPKGTRTKRKAAGRFGVLNEFVDCSMDGLTRAEIAVWLVLYRDVRDGVASTSQSDIARRAGISRKSVGKAIRKLEGRGLLQVVYRGGFHRGISKYRVRGGT